MEFSEERMESLSDFQNRLNEIEAILRKEARSIGLKDIQFFYRGVGDKEEACDEQDVPGIFREENEEIFHNEDKIIKQALVEKPEWFENCHFTIEKLEILQHYGLPTRLLDITSNCLVALWFACHFELENDGSIIVYALETKNIKYNDSDTVSVLANCALMPDDFSVVSKNDGQLKKDKFSEKLFVEITKEKSYFQRKIEYQHMNDYVVCVLPSRIDARIKAQDGCFLLFGLKEGKKKEHFSFSEKSNSHIIKSKIRIPKLSKEKIISDLERVGVSEAKLFPDLEHYCKGIKEKFLGKSLRCN